MHTWVRRLGIHRKFTGTWHHAAGRLNNWHICPGCELDLHWNEWADWRPEGRVHHHPQCASKPQAARYLNMASEGDARAQATKHMHSHCPHAAAASLRSPLPVTTRRLLRPTTGRLPPRLIRMS